MENEGLAAVLDRIAQREAADPESYPKESIDELHSLGLIRGPLPHSLGGSGRSLVDGVDLVESLATASPSVALIASMPLGLAGVFSIPAEAVPETHRGTWSDQVERVAAAYRAGEHFAACNSERGAGGSLAATQCVATRGADGAFRISGDKILASGGRFAQHFFSTAKVTQEDVPGAGIVEFFFLRSGAPGVEILSDWGGFGMRSTESQTVRYSDAVASELMGFPNFIEAVQPLHYWFCLFAAVPLGCAGGMIKTLASPAPASPALRLRFTEATMRYESLRAYLRETAAGWRPGSSASWRMRVLRTKTFVSQESTKLAAELFALSGGRHYRRTGSVARSLADSFAGTALRPPLPLALDTLVEGFSIGDLGEQ
jgi:alkylation response protein AidB-like acyl-CoA dehydrogenase